jgi:hypothetical protein
MLKLNKQWEREKERERDGSCRFEKHAGVGFFLNENFPKVKLRYLKHSNEKKEEEEEREKERKKNKTITTTRENELKESNQQELGCCRRCVCVCQRFIEKEES